VNERGQVENVMLPASLHSVWPRHKYLTF